MENDKMIINVPAPLQSEPESAFGGKFWNLKYWLIVGLASSALFFFTKPLATPYWFFEPLLFAIFVFGYWFNIRRVFAARVRVSPRTAVIAYVILASLTGLLYELSVSDIPSQIFGQGEISFLFYIPFAILGWWAIRKYHLTFQDAYFVGGVASIFEMMFFAAGALLSPFFFILPLVIANYFLVYGMYLALPLLFIDEKLLWRNAESTERKNLTKTRALWIGIWISAASWASNYVLGYLIRYVVQ